MAYGPWHPDILAPHPDIFAPLLACHGQETLFSSSRLTGTPLLTEPLLEPGGTSSAPLAPLLAPLPGPDDTATGHSRFSPVPPRTRARAAPTSECLPPFEPELLTDLVRAFARRPRSVRTAAPSKALRVVTKRWASTPTLSTASPTRSALADPCLRIARARRHPLRRCHTRPLHIGQKAHPSPEPRG